MLFISSHKDILLELNASPKEHNKPNNNARGHAEWRGLEMSWPQVSAKCKSWSALEKSYSRLGTEQRKP